MGYTCSLAPAAAAAFNKPRLVQSIGKTHFTLVSRSTSALLPFFYLFIFSHQCGSIKSFASEKRLTSRWPIDGFTCKSRHRAGSYGCRNSRRCWLDIRGDRRIGRTAVRIRSCDLDTGRKGLSEHENGQRTFSSACP